MLKNLSFLLLLFSSSLLSVAQTEQERYTNSLTNIYLTSKQDIETLELNYAGANNNMYLIRKNEMIEYAANRQPVGAHYKMTDFDCHTIQLQKGDTIYLFTDGYADQFGGENGKKLKYKPFKELLLTISNHPVEEQKRFLNKHFMEWKGDYEQVDDVCVIGVKI